MVGYRLNDMVVLFLMVIGSGVSQGSPHIGLAASGRVKSLFRVTTESGVWAMAGWAERVVSQSRLSRCQWSGITYATFSSWEIQKGRERDREAHQILFSGSGSNATVLSSSGLAI